MTKKILPVFLSLALLLPACASGATVPGTPVLKMAVLPIIDSLPMYVAQEEGLFAGGVQIELVPVASAPERDQLLAAGQVDGTINEILSVILFNREEIQLQTVRYALRPEPGYGHFFILASAKSGITTVDGLKGAEIGVSEGTVIEYVTQRVLEAEGLTGDEIRMIAVPRIPDRMSMLASGALEAGVMPDPLAAMAVLQGSLIVADDSEYPQYGSSVYSFRAEVIQENPGAVEAFLAAVEEAVELINADPQKFRSVLGEQGILPEALLETYTIPPFPTAGVPGRDEWEDSQQWLREKGLLEREVSFEESVLGTFLPGYSSGCLPRCGEQQAAVHVP